MTRAFPVACVAIAAAATLATAAEPPTFESDVLPVLKQTCVGCHGARRPKGGIDLSKFPDAASARRDPDLWERVGDVLTDRSMPPQGKPAPGDDERGRAVEAIAETLSVQEGPRDPGPGPVQRLTRSQYNNTLRDLLGVDLRPADAFPVDGAGGEGFDNNASTLFVSPIFMERHLAAVAEVIEKADPTSWRVAVPREGVTKDEAARLCIERFAARAFRRPPGRDEVDRLMGLFRRAEARGDDFDAAVKLALRGALASPRFLFIGEAAKGGSEPYRIDDYELASRLSYFLWSSCPDDSLYDLAKAGTLHEDEVLAGQVRRMLADTRSEALARDFAGQWLGVDRLATVAEPDGRTFPTYTPALRDAMAEEPIAFFQGLLRDNAPLLDLLDADYAYLNQPLAEHYGIKDVAGNEFRRVALTDRSRGGVLGMGAVLTLTSYPRRTSPVLRGKWVLEELLGTPPPPPPPNVKVLPADDRAREGLTFRRRLEQHRADAKCASCHAKMDPLGFGLETFDPIGRLRDTVGGEPVDASGVLAGGVEFRGSAELKKILRDDKRDLFVRNLSGKMLSYALRRGLEYYDAPTVKEIAAAVEADDFRAQSLVIAIVESIPFRFRRDAGPSANPSPKAEP
ncbi:DUF1592 domain-containing protein [Tundrisphaera sp. TA3]|uniref:DUF1592 domain-containing protein n=1 Tax=Tundrisphaera sp. TA3 TaxID=3435775 RepID=UPI003EB6C139